MCSDRCSFYHVQKSVVRSIPWFQNFGGSCWLLLWLWLLFVSFNFLLLLWLWLLCLHVCPCVRFKSNLMEHWFWRIARICALKLHRVGRGTTEGGGWPKRHRNDSIPSCIWSFLNMTRAQVEQIDNHIQHNGDQRRRWQPILDLFMVYESMRQCIHL